ncbi:MAG: sigma-E processing peptidase SpoIIGA [Clostridia bacterium]|nr:sigma-E processing peptidase SpoIIGA [Clostridia bacterium]MBR0227685.1 sigma-E processing peptidase SpoIIGA [Clostridia bacterium]
MRVYGEAFFFINGWMDFVCLLLAARLGRSRFHAGKALISAGLGGVYGVLAWTAETRFLRGVPSLLLWCLLLCWVAFGKRCPRLFPLVLSSGWLLSGLSNFVLERGGPPGAVILMDSGAALAVLLLTQRISDRSGHFRIQIAYREKTVEARAMRDTGNLLAEVVSGLPVIVLPERLGRTFLPPGTNLKDLSTLPPGWRLVRAKTAAGSRALMCFTPDAIILRQGTRVFHAEAAAAVADFEEDCALLPDSLFSEQREGMRHAVL